jgi:hypothetical protein
LLAAPLGCRDGGSPSEAKISVTGREASIAIADHRWRIPAEDLGRDVPPVVQDASGRRLAYATASAAARVLYRVGEGIFVGPLMRPPFDFRATPDLDHVLGPLYEQAGKSRPELLREMARERGPAGATQLLAASSYVDEPSWEEAALRLSPDERRALAEGLARGLEPNEPAPMLRRAVRFIDLTEPSRRHLVVARAADPSAWDAEPASAAVLLRALIPTSPKEASRIGCDVLKRLPDAQASASSMLAEAALLAVLAQGADCAGERVVERLLASEPCLPYYRCNDEGPLSWNSTTDQTEPLCSRPQVDKEIAAELARPKSAVVDASVGRAGLFAYALAQRRGHILAGFERAHARRRYPITQVAEPRCDAHVAPNAACRCEETTIRARACTTKDQGPTTSSGYCGFEIDDAQQKIKDVVRATPVQ